MGLAIERDEFTSEDFRAFEARLRSSVGVLGEILARPDFGRGEASLGAELELALIDADARPSPINHRVLGESLDPRLTFELNRFNLECNLRHGPLAGRPFTALAGEMRDSQREVKRAAALHDARIAAIGILPTLRDVDLQRSAMSDSARFRALSRGLQRLRKGPFRVRIDGAEPLDTECDDVTFEGAATSLQLHLRVEPGEFARLYNAAQMASVPAIALAANSPTFLGRRLWHETRVALFKQAVDDRSPIARRSGRQARVSFGTGWLRGGALELFETSVALYEPLLPVLSEEDPEDALREGTGPALEELRLHQGTVWLWNRPVYDPAEGGHLRIELRALPAGPSVADMVANAAFLVGLARGLAEEGDAWQRGFPFGVAQGSFYRAAQRGLDAELGWPPAPGEAPVPVRAAALVERLLPLAERGLRGAGVEADECARWLGIVADRVAARVTGAGWQLRVLDVLERELERSTALAHMLESYVAHAEGGAPVHTWPVDG